jgi:calcineurin-like phosphoesterase family protein/2'-5' RNA ligase
MLIEIRIGPGKKKLSGVISKIQHVTRIRSSKVHRVPHISLYGGFSVPYDRIESIKAAIESIGNKYNYLPYLIDGFKCISGRKGKVIYFNIVPSKELKEFRDELAKKLLKIAPDTVEYDKQEPFLFHATLAFKLYEEEYQRIWPYLSGEKPISEEGYTLNYFYLLMNALRVTFLNNSRKIICEYDFLQKRCISRRESLNRHEWGKTLKLFRQNKGMEIDKPIKGKKQIYLISDLHLDHANIIRYCVRPFLFSNVKEMNHILINNWNNIVSDKDEIYFLGDMSFGRRSRPATYWLKNLNGKKHIIKGNHGDDVKGAKDNEILEYKKYKFLLIHDPKEAKKDWNGWIIHGHTHDNDMKIYPFINGERKTINVSCELINYKPISLDYLISLKLDTIKRMDTIDSEIERF